MSPNRSPGLLGIALAVAATAPFVGGACASSSGNPPAQAGPSTISSLDFSPSLVVIRKGDAKPIKVTATMGDGTKKDVTNDVQWISENPGTATVDEHGTVVGAGAGITTVKVTYRDASGSVKVTVAP